MHRPLRDYILFEGPLKATHNLDEPFGDRLGKTFFPQSPNLIWPDDRAWCVATEIDLYDTVVAGSAEAIDAILANDRLEAWRVDAGDPITNDSDLINT